MPAVAFRPFQTGDTSACLALFDANCPEFFAPNERADYADFLASEPAGYEVALDSDRIVAAFGVLVENAEPHLRWILVAPAAQGRGLGTGILQRAVSAAQTHASAVLRIAASHRSEPFFQRAGATRVQFHPDGWGPGMHRVDMILPLGGNKR